MKMDAVFINGIRTNIYLYTVLITTIYKHDKQDEYNYLLTDDYQMCTDNDKS